MKSGIVLYDITLTRYRTKIAKVLEAYGERIQLSVFKFNLKNSDFKLMIQLIRSIYKEYIKECVMKGMLNDSKRSIRIYIICESCMEKHINIGPEDKERRVYII